jgi:hypothetical protein
MTSKFCCPRCGYSTNHKTSINLHFKRKNTCKVIVDGIVLSDEVKQSVLNGSFISPHFLKQTAPCITTNNIVNIMINGKCNIMTNQIIVDRIAPHVDKLKWGQGKVFDRLNVYQEKVQDANHTFCEDDVYIMAKDITETRDQRRLTDAYYSFDVKNKTYFIRKDDDEHAWIWVPCLMEDIFDDITVQLEEYVFKYNEVKLNNEYKENKVRALPKIIEFYKILKYLLMEPQCCVANWDNEILYMSSDAEHLVPNGYELRDELKQIFTETQTDAWQMMNCREKIGTLIRGNGETTFEMIENLVGSMFDFISQSKDQ